MAIFLPDRCEANAASKAAIEAAVLAAQAAFIASTTVLINDAMGLGFFQVEPILPRYVSSEFVKVYFEALGYFVLFPIIPPGPFNPAFVPGFPEVLPPGYRDWGATPFDNGPPRIKISWGTLQEPIDCCLEEEIMDNFVLAGRTFTKLNGFIDLISAFAGSTEGVNAALFLDPRSTTGLPYSVPAGKTLQVIGLANTNGIFGYCDSSGTLTAQWTEVFFAPDVSGSLAGKYFFINEPVGSSVAAGAYIWFKVGGVGSDPGPFGSRVGFECDIATNSTAAEISTAVQNLLAGNPTLQLYISDFSAGVNPNNLILSNIPTGAITPYSDNGSGTGFAFSVVLTGGLTAIAQVNSALLVNPKYSGMNYGQFAINNANQAFYAGSVLVSFTIPSGKIPFIQGGLNFGGGGEWVLYGFELPASC